eukprot:Rhum_TRINITY_DN4486_c0_g1::Rhum_TRINITY_DN4486_c0_g1_i1::g.14534::m.14534
MTEECIVSVEEESSRLELLVLEQATGNELAITQLCNLVASQNQVIGAQSEKLQKHDAALALFREQMTAQVERESLLADVADQRAKYDVLKRKEEDICAEHHKLKKVLEEMREHHSSERTGLLSRISSLESECCISMQDVDHKEDVVRELERQNRQSAKRVEKSEYAYILETQRLSSELKAAHELQLAERQGRVDAENKLFEQEHLHKEAILRLNNENFNLKLTLGCEEKRVHELGLQAKCESDSLNKKVRELKGLLDIEEKRAIQQRETCHAQESVLTHALRQQLEDLQREHTELNANFERASAELKHKTRLLDESTADLAKTQQMYLAEAVKYNAVNSSGQTGMNMLKKELEECNRIKLKGARLLQETTREHTLKVQKMQAQSRDEVSLLHTTIETIQNQENVHKTEYARLEESLADTKDQYVAERTDHATTREQLAKAKDEIAKLQRVSTAVHDNFHFRIATEQLSEKAQEIQYLTNRVRGLEAKLQGVKVDAYVLDAREALGDSSLRSRMNVAEASGRSLRVVLLDVLAALSKPTKDETVLRDGAPLLHQLSSTLQRDLALLAQDDVHAPIKEPHWETVSQENSADQRDKLSIPGPHLANKFAGLPASIPGTVDSSLYLAQQKTKPVPSIYDLDW